MKNPARWRGGWTVGLGVGQSRLEIVDCGHLFILTDPAGTAARIESFLHGERAGAAVRHAPAAGRPLHN